MASPMPRSRPLRDGAARPSQGIREPVRRHRKLPARPSPRSLAPQLQCPGGCRPPKKLLSRHAHVLDGPGAVISWRWADDDYPRALLEIADPPTVLYALGDTGMLNRPAMAMVGSRNATRQGVLDAQEFARVLSESGYAIASGLALGIDSAAHRGGLAGPSSTIAVVGTGLDRVYPAANRDLAGEIAARGVIVSEFPLGTPPVAANFPRRNRIISGLSRGVLVVEAALKSGSLTTARFALEQGREVFAIPGSIHSPFSKGCHWLIKQGAKLVRIRGGRTRRTGRANSAARRAAILPRRTGRGGSRAGGAWSFAREPGCAFATQGTPASQIAADLTQLESRAAWTAAWRASTGNLLYLSAAIGAANCRRSLRYRWKKKMTTAPWPQNLLIVESPSKAKTLKNYLGMDFEILASYGHVRDLVPKPGAVDPDDNFRMKYEIIDRNAKHVEAIAWAVKTPTPSCLRPTRTAKAEAIAWHLSEILKGKRALKDKKLKRVVFYEIYRGAVKDAVKHPREISMELVNAQQARRALDYLAASPLAAALEEDPPGPVGGPRPEPACASSSSAEHRGSRASSRASTGRSTLISEKAKDAVHGEAHPLQGREARQFSVGDAARKPRSRDSSRRTPRAWPAFPRSRRSASCAPRPTLYDLHAAAGGGEKARLFHRPRHESRASLYEGVVAREGRDGSHHLHAHRLRDPGQGGSGGDAGIRHARTTARTTSIRLPITYKSTAKNAQEPTRPSPDRRWRVPPSPSHRTSTTNSASSTR